MPQFFDYTIRLLASPLHYIYTCALFQRIWTFIKQPQPTPYTGGRYIIYAPGYGETFSHQDLPSANQIILPPTSLYSAREHTKKIIACIQSCPYNEIDCIGYSLSAQPTYIASTHNYSTSGSETQKNIRFIILNGASSLSNLFLYRHDISYQLLGLTLLIILTSITIIAATLSVNFYRLWLILTIIFSAATICLILPSASQFIHSHSSYPRAFKQTLDDTQRYLYNEITEQIDSIYTALLSILYKIIAMVLLIPIGCVNQILYPALAIIMTTLCSLNIFIVTWLFESIDTPSHLAEHNLTLIKQSNDDIVIPLQARLLNLFVRDTKETLSGELPNSKTYYMSENGGHDRLDNLAAYSKALDDLTPK